MPFAPPGDWNPNSGQTMQRNNEVDESGVQVRPMGLKVHYTFDKEAKVNCLARSPQTLHVQTVPLDDKNSIGIVDLRACLLAVTECSPELASQGNDTNTDFTVYSLDYSEPDTPLVGQGMLSWALDTMRGDWAAQPPKMVTGRVTKNLLAVFGGGNRETLEVKLRFTTCPKVQKPEPTQDMQLSRPTESLVTPSGAAEWNSFLQSNPQIGHSAHVSRVASPTLSQGPSAPEVQRVAPTPVDPATAPMQPTSRPSSRSSRKRAPTGRPRGRPRKKPAEGNTSGYEDGTEGEDSGPAKKKAKTATNTTKETTQNNQPKEIKTTKMVKTNKPEKAAPNPFTSGPDSLRVTASTASSLRNFRPVGPTSEGMSGSHLQEVPRAPTPVPEGGPLNMPRGGPKGPKPRRESSMRQEMTANLSNQLPPRPARALSPSQEDHRSPESAIETPAYSEDSPQDIRSSPPVPRNASFMQSSPPMSSPILPPMPAPVQDSTFTDDIDDLFDEPILQPVKESRIRGRPPVKVIESVDSTGIPTQVFRIDGPDGQGLVHIQNYNTPHPTSGPVGSPHLEPSLPLPKPRKNHARPQTARNPPQARPQRRSPPTPPPTTDAPEKMGSPVPVQAPCAAEVPQPQVEPQTQPGDGLDEPLLQLVRATSGLEPMPSTETNQIPQGTLPPRKPVSNPVNPQPRTSRQLNRSQSAGILPLPSVPASEPVGPSTLSESHLTEPIRASTEIPACLRRSKSIVMHLPVPASDPIGPVESLEHLALPAPPEGSFPQSDALPGMPSSPPYKYKKNMVKKHAIKQKLEMAILNGEMPPFCANCGAIETPTWRKIWVQELEGVPQYVEYSDKPGQITAILITKRDEQNVPLAYRIVKKSLGLKDIRDAWTEQLLCNPCGIWIGKYRVHRPQDKWANAFGPLCQSRRKRGSSTNPNPSSSKAKKARTKSISYPNPTSEAYPTTDPVGPVEPSSPKQSGSLVPTKEQRGDMLMDNTLALPSFDGLPNHDGNRSNPGSTHSRSSRGLGTAESPIEMDIDDDLGNTRRLLFSSPQKDSTMKTLGEIDANVVKLAEYRQDKELSVEKENVAAEARDERQNEQDALEALFHSPARPSTPSPKSKAKTRSERQSEQDALEALFHSPARPSTPPPKSKAEAQTTPFKTPTRPTPNHRPITRSVSRSIRSVRGMMSPSQQALLQKTPTKTPRSAGLRRSPRLNVENLFDTPTCRTITQLLSEPNLDLDNTQFDFSSLPNMEITQNTIVEFGNFLSTDGIMPSSPPRDGALSFGYSGSDDVFAEWGMEQRVTAKEAVTVKEAKE
ncbi:hypothetical protein BHE90_014543 [Fusarium euwallaceae]|uniref:Ams2/SPT21 N-terminal domain-containing protein n=1 Tax=Fusarium euwallaceae TaxID=1147111 RepID=A0A430L5Q3_9HYPO|nr:hypothetical protein BHE90_014543 [Fusarium euwallaceae]